MPKDNTLSNNLSDFLILSLLGNIKSPKSKDLGVNSSINEARYASGVAVNINTKELKIMNNTPPLDLKKEIKKYTQFLINSGANISPLPKVKLLNNDIENASKLLGNTAYYDPENKLIVLYTYGRHPKDILRSYSHELVHHTQNLEGRLQGIDTTNITEDEYLTQIESEANLIGTMSFRTYTDSIRKNEY